MSIRSPLGVAFLTLSMAWTQAVALYRVKLAVTGTSRSLSTTEDTVVCILEKPDSVSDREDELIKKAASLASSKADQSATRYQGSADVSHLPWVLQTRFVCAGQTTNFAKRVAS